jgi:hypothetical protein
MKSGEFDDLLRQKFEQNDFEFNPKSWDKLVEQLEDRPRKRNMLIWWAMPVAGMAASVALAMGAASLVKYGMPTTAGAGSTSIAAHKTAQPKRAQRSAVAYTTTNEITPLQAEAQAAPMTKATKQEVQNTTEDNSNNGFNSRLQAIADNTPTIAPVKEVREAAKTNDAAIAKKKPVTINDWNMANVTEEDMQKASGFSVTVSGGINYGQRNNGFSAGATVRKMINTRVYVEGDVAFTNSANVQRSTYQTYEDAPASTSAATAARSAAKITSSTSEELAKLMTPPPKIQVTKQQDDLYSMQYAQVTPTIGYKIMDKFSIGAGPDFQQALADNRPAKLADNPENQRVAPLFDIGFMGKTEFALAKRVKAAVYYRKGINNVITPMNKYIDRDYLQFQIKCTVFDK